MLRSALFVPCAQERVVAKAASLDCDALIFDLEDAVSDFERDDALHIVAQVLSTDRIKAPHVLVRIHPQSLNAIHKALRGLKLDGVVVPKVASPDDLHGVAALWPGMALWAMIETAAGVANLAAIAATAHRHVPLKGLIAGPNDLRKSLRTRAMPERQDITFALSQIVLHGRANGLALLDGVYNAYTDEAGFAAECEQGRSLGFDGKTLIHPSQIAAAEAAFSPSDAEIAWA